MNTCKKIIATALSSVFVLYQATMLTAVSSEITGLTGNNGVYNINPTALITGSDIGYRKYKDFVLDKGDIANLIFKYGATDVETFINLVDSQVKINGIVNSMRDGNFYNGRAVFVSPNGVVVGSSGVINVGSLGVYTPTTAVYEDYKNNPHADLTVLQASNNNGTVTVDGKVIATNNIDIHSGNINITKNGGMIAGTDNFNIVNTNEQAEQLFNSIVNTKNIHNANNISKANGNITLTSSVGTTVNGLMNNYGKGNTKIVNTGVNGIKINGKTENHNGDYEIRNNNGNLVVTGNLGNRNGTMRIINNGHSLDIKKDANVYNSNDLLIANNGKGGMQLNGKINNSRDAYILNTAGALNLGGSFENGRNATLQNSGNEGLNVTGSIKNGNTLSLINSGVKGLNITGDIYSEGNIKTNNTGAKGTNLASSGKITSNKDIYINDKSQSGIRIEGLINAKENVSIEANGGNVVIGDNTKNDNYVTAGNNIDINVQNGSILNSGVEKVLLVAGGDLTMKAINGTIGLPVQQKACEGSGCTGIGPKSDDSRDFTKSINAKVNGKVKAETIAETNASKEQDLVINYAAIDSDMNIDTIKADGKVILTVDDSGHAFNGVADGKRYNMVNARPNDNTDTNIEGWGISLISNGSIGTKDNKVTFIQNRAQDGYSMDALVNENMYLKENSYNDLDYGAEKEIATNKVCTMIAREGDMDVEFAGNTTIENITAEGDMNITTRGKTLEIKNLGHITDNSVIPEDYFGPRVDGQKDGGYMKEDYRDEVLPNHVTIAALDINKNIRPNGEDLDGYYGWADSTVKVDNAVLDNGTLDITADNVYANGIEAHFNKDGFDKKVNDTTNPVIGASAIPTGHAVRPNDVTAIGRDEHERNYYYPTGDGDGIFDGKPSNVDSDNGIVDATPLAIPDVGPGPSPKPQPDPSVDPDKPDGQSGDITYIQRKIVDNAVDTIDKRQFMRFRVSDNTNPVLMENQHNGVNNLLDVSRGGVAVSHAGALKVGDVIPVHLTYGDLDINANVKIVSATSSRAGAEFVNIDKALANQLLYLSILLESKNNLLAGNFY